MVGRLDRTVFFAPMATGTERNVEFLAACVQSGPLFISADDFLFKGRDVFFWHDCTSIIPNPQIISSKTRYSDNIADFPLQRRTTKQEVKKHESERSVLFLHPRQTSFRQNRPFHITRFPASKRTSPYVRQASVLADYKSNHDQMLIFFRKQYGRYRNFPVRCMISYDFLKIYSLLINFAADVI